MSQKPLPNSLPKKPPGSLRRHPQTGGWYWRVSRRHVPAGIRGKRKILDIPLTPQGAVTATKSKGVAEAIRKMLWQRWHPKPGSATPKMLASYLDGFEDWCAQQSVAQTTKFNVWAVKQFIDRSGLTEPWALSRKAVQDYLIALRKEDELAPRTQMKHRSAISMFCRYLIEEEILDHNVAINARVQQTNDSPPRFLTDDQVDALLAKDLPDWLRLAVMIGLETGARVGEIRQLTHEAILPQAIQITASKTRNFRYVPISDVLRPALPVGGAGPMFPEMDRWAWGKALKAVTKDMPIFGTVDGGRAGKQWHLLRSTFAVRRARGIGLERPATLWELMAWMGHSNPKTMQYYIDLARAFGVE